MLSNPEAVDRMQRPDLYKTSQPDLDKYRPAFEGMGLHPKFAGSDLDGIFSMIIDVEQPEGGFWERHGCVLIQEHKLSSTSTKSIGQFRALAELAKISPDRLAVIFTYGPPNDPTEQTWQCLLPNGQLSPVEPFTTDVEKWPHRRWIRKANARAAPGAVMTRAQIADCVELIAKIEACKQRLFLDVLASLRTEQ